jgi:DNA polymerase
VDLTEERPDLGELESRIGDCHRCALGDTRTKLVFGVGSPDAELMFVGEAPGKNEDLQGEPFVGAAGKLLDELLGGIGLSRADVYVANILKCRPPGNRDPEREQIETCTPFLEEQIRRIDPRVIVTLGNFATKYILETDNGISRIHGRLFTVGGRKVVPVYHPAAALYTPAKKDVLAQDFQRIGIVLEGDDLDEFVAAPGEVVADEAAGPEPAARPTEAPGAPSADAPPAGETPGDDPDPEALRLF